MFQNTEIRLLLDEIFVKLDYAKWTEWDDNEIKAIKDYVFMDWIEFAKVR